MPGVSYSVHNSDAVILVSAYIVASDAFVRTRIAAISAKSIYGDFIQICDGVADEVEAQAAIDAVPVSS